MIKTKLSYTKLIEKVTLVGQYVKNNNENIKCKTISYKFPKYVEFSWINNTAQQGPRN